MHIVNNILFKQSIMILASSVTAILHLISMEQFNKLLAYCEHQKVMHLESYYTLLNIISY